MTDPISDMLARIKNAAQRRFRTVDIPHSKIKRTMLDVLVKEGYVNDVEDVVVAGRQFLRVDLRYYEGRSVIKILDRVSKPSLRTYSKLKKIRPFFNGLGVYILSTSKGVMSDTEARENNVGGEVLCRVF
ncbi:MAG: 30S ribosomal protein S8 [Holosporaceae bacterium]|jgi:small subunit ribosomal protein S8|nr:30S ribosomal protein S8 [Holosporaceae bacterium]